MGIELTTLNELTVDEVQEKMALLTRLLQEKHPEIDVSTGALHDIVLYLYAIMEAKSSKEIDRYRSAQSLLDISADATLAEEGVVDKVLSNYNVSRKPATYSKGRIVLEYAADLNTLIPVGTEFVYGGDTYATVEGALVMSVDSVSFTKLTRLANGNYAFVVDVVSTSVGATSIVKKGQEFTTSLPDVVTAYAEDDFVIGEDEETNLSMLARLAEGLATPCWGNRYQVANLLRSRMDDLTDVSVVGFGDLEMSRDKLSPFPISVGGRSDVYIKTRLQTMQVPCMATYSHTVELDDMWTSTIPSTALPALYRVNSASVDGNEYRITSQCVVDGIEGAADQVVSVSFATDDQDFAVASEDPWKEFTFSVVGQTSIDTATAILTSRELMPITEDVRILTAHPAWVTVTLKLSSVGAQDSAIDAAIVDMINATGFCGRLPVSSVLKVALPLLEEGQEILETTLSVEIWGNDNEVLRAVTSQMIEIPDEPNLNITPRTTVFYCRDVIRSY